MTKKVKLFNVSVKRGGKFRPKQNLSIDFWQLRDIDENSSDDEILVAIKQEFSNIVKLTNSSRIEIFR
jgi:hypothetical protein